MNGQQESGVELSSLTLRPSPVFYNEPLAPVLFSPESHALELSIEQEGLIKGVLSLASSDTRFAQKAADAIRLILVSGQSQEIPVISSINPPQRKVGSTQFKLTVLGSGFGPMTVLHISGNPVPTLYVSATELSTNVSLATVTEPTTYPIVAVTGAGIVSNTMVFNATAAV